MKPTLLLCLVIILCIADPLSAQDRVRRKRTGDSTMLVDFDLGRLFKNKTPTVSAWYGESTYMRDGLGGTVEPAMSYGGSISMQRTRLWDTANSITKHTASGVYLWNAQGDDASVAGATSFNVLRIGIYDEEGYGYRFGSNNSGITFISGGSLLSWYNLSVLTTSPNAQSAQSVNDFIDGIRFGESMKPGVAWRVAEPLSVRAGFEWSQIYPRHQFWYWFLSHAMEGIADGAATWFVEEIGDSSPAAMPVMYFLLKTGVATGFKALRMNQMNWPFNTVAPMNMYTWSVGFDVHF